MDKLVRERVIDCATYKNLSFVGGTLRRKVRGERFYAKSRLPIGHDYVGNVTRRQTTDSRYS